MPRPKEGEFKEFMINYISLVPEEDIVPTIRHSLQELQHHLSSIPANLGDHAYAEGKWTVKQLMQHAIDTERVFAYRALCIARGEEQPLPGFDENSYAAHADVSGRTLKDLCDEMMVVRQSTVMLFVHLHEPDLRKEGIASGSRVLVNSLGYVIVGHWRHHWNILKTKYGV
jgi:DinB superfamily